MMRDPPLDVVAVAIEDALRDRDVLLEDLPGLELHAQLTVRPLFLGDEDRSGRVAVEAMHDARPIFAALLAQLAEMEGQGVDQGA